MANQIILELVRSIDWGRWLKRTGNGSVRCYKDDIVDTCIDIVRELEYAHDIDWVEMAYTSCTLHVDLAIGGKAYHGRFPFSRLDRYHNTCSEMTKEKKAEIGSRFKKLLLDAIGRR